MSVLFVNANLIKYFFAELIGKIAVNIPLA